MKVPFIKRFRTKHHHYIYDINSNHIFRVNNVEYDIADDVGKKDIGDLIKAHQNKYLPIDIHEAFTSMMITSRRGEVLSNKRPSIAIGVESEKDVKNALKSGLRQLILEITQRCNLRCRYCIYSGNYNFNRNHNSKDMTYVTAHKAIRYFLSRSIQSPRPAITFYGGEPLLNQRLIIKTVEFAKGFRNGTSPTFSLTTNGLLLKDDIVRYLVKNGIYVVVSLDGPKEIQDRYRIFKNGKGSYDIVMRNLIRMGKLYPDYFSRYVSVAATLAPPYALREINDFFFNNDLFAPVADRFRATLVDPRETTFFDDFEFIPDTARSRFWGSLFRGYRNALMEARGEVLSLPKAFFDKEFYEIENREITPIGNFFYPRGACFPGKRKIFVSSEGGFFLCEKVGANYRIGEVECGFDFKRIYRLIRNYESYFRECGNCWALRLCNRCFNNIRRGDDISQERKKEYCLEKLRNLEKYLIAYCEIKERNLSAFSFLRNVFIQ